MKFIISLFLIIMIIPSFPCHSMPVGNISDPFVLGKGLLFKTKKDFGFFVGTEHINTNKKYNSRTDQTIRLQKQQFSDILLKRTSPGGSSTAMDITVNGDEIKVAPISEEDSSGTFTLFLRNGKIVQLSPDIDDSGTLVSQKTKLKYNGLKVGMSYKNHLFLYGMIGKGSLSKNVRFVYQIDETQNVTVEPENSDDTITSNILENMSYSWDDQTREVDAINRKFETDEDIIWGVGISVIMYEKLLNKQNMLRLGMDTKFRKINLESNSLSFDETTYKWDLDQLQMAFSVSLQINRFPLFNYFIPYTGITYSYISGNETVIMANDNAEEKKYIPYFNSNSDIEINKNFGYFTGVSFSMFEYAQINFEKRFSDEEGAEISVLIKF